jgi:hypothetical protein
VGVVGGDPRVAFGGRRRRILSCVRGWASPMVVRGAVRCRDCERSERERVPFAAGTERSEREGGNEREGGKMKPRRGPTRFSSPEN